ncbi:hypothetical protein EI546_08630 [Aequorivita sp. H23M31]|uniref:Uncharacterized protein n=1 Tax=Aequorivita ciconiae TaxID=2494375 RepID=A0A410G3F8_9FLAO|nr:hypothetical protein [Aequorivita sp. H23M31]QAA81781.1 hypothetical protein EI546_08630 [Aequorivita sp. H23M31]
MGKTKKIIELDNKAIEILEKQAKLQKRSLKNYLEFLSEEYKVMMDGMIERDENGTLITHSLKDILQKYGR